MSFQSKGRRGLPSWMFWLMVWMPLCAVLPAWGQAPGDEGPARPVRVAVVDIVGEGVEQSLALSLTATIKREAGRNPAFELVQQEQIDLVDSLLLFGCEEVTPECLAQLAESVGADLVIYGRLTQNQGMRQVSAYVFDAQRMRVARTWSRRFSAQVDAASFFAQEMETFLGGRRDVEPARLRVSSNVRASAVIVDGKLIGRSPMMTERLAPGTYQVEVTREGYTRELREVTLVAGEDARIEVTLKPLESEQGEAASSAPVPTLKTAPPSGSVLSDDAVKLGPLGWSLLSLGALTLGAGGVMGALTAQTQADFDATSLEREGDRLRSRGERQARAANILFGVGGGSAALGAVLLIIDAAQESQDEPLVDQLSVGLQEGGGVVMWRHAF